MEFKQVPIRVIGPGSQPAEADGQRANYIDMPGDMWTYRPPPMPEPDEVRHLAGARESMRWLKRALADCGDGSVSRLADLSALDDDDRELVNQLLGEGEVSLSFDAGFRVRAQESVLAGVWRSLFVDDDERVVADVLEVAAVPQLVYRQDGRDRAIDTDCGDLPADVINAPAILVELESRLAAYAASGRPHEVNLTLLPLTDADLAFLDARLGRGPVDTLSRAYGQCQVVSTAVPNLWWVRFFNSMGTPILTTLEVVDVPAVLRAAPEDLRDSAARLDAMLAPYWDEFR